MLIIQMVKVFCWEVDTIIEEIKVIQSEMKCLRQKVARIPIVFREKLKIAILD